MQIMTNCLKIVLTIHFFGLHSCDHFNLTKNKQIQFKQINQPTGSKKTQMIANECVSSQNILRGRIKSIINKNKLSIFFCVVVHCWLVLSENMHL